MQTQRSICQDSKIRILKVIWNLLTLILNNNHKWEYILNVQEEFRWNHSFVRLKPNVLMLYKETSSQIQDWDEMLSWWTDTWKTISPFCLYCSFTEVFLARMAYSYIISSKPWKCSTMLGSCLFLVRQKLFLHLEIHKPRTSVAFTHKYRFWDLSRWILT